jgi:dihydroxyacetone kinase
VTEKISCHEKKRAAKIAGEEEHGTGIPGEPQSQEK